jgi:hypothetical protein
VADITKHLESFDPEVHPALMEGLAILEKQAAEVHAHPRPTELPEKYLLDFNVFRWVADGVVGLAALPADGGFAVTHLQMEEAKACKDGGLRTKQLLAQASLRCKVLSGPATVDRFEVLKSGMQTRFATILGTLDAANNSKATNPRDAVIIEAAIVNGVVLITAEADLQKAAERHGGRALLIARATA